MKPNVTGNDRSGGTTRREVVRSTGSLVGCALAASWLPFGDLLAAADAPTGAARAGGRTDEHLAELMSGTVDPVFDELVQKFFKNESRFRSLPYLFDRLMAPEEARMLLEMPAPTEAIAEKLGMPAERVSEALRGLYLRGVVAPTPKGFAEGWQVVRPWGVLHDTLGATADAHVDPDVLDLAYAVHRENLETMAALYGSYAQKYPDRISRNDDRSIGIMRVVPRWRSIENVPGVIPHEDARQILKNGSPILVFNCACKQINRNRACGDHLTSKTCIIMGSQAVIERGNARELSYQEALDYLDHLDESGVVHLVGGKSPMPRHMCNCCPCCCGVFDLNRLSMPGFGLSAPTRSRYRSQVDPERCSGCTTCVSKCPNGAITMQPVAGESRSYAAVDEAACIGCGVCVINCPETARSMKTVRPPEFITERPAAAGPTSADGVMS